MASGDAKEQVPRGWTKIPWVRRRNPETGEDEYLNGNLDKRIPMFEVGDILRIEKFNRSVQVVNTIPYDESPNGEWWYCVTREFGKSAVWKQESMLYIYDIMQGFYDSTEQRANFARNRLPRVTNFLDPKLIKNDFDDLYEEGTRVSMVFDFRTQTPGAAKLYYGTITRRKQKLATAEWVWYYTVTFDDGDVKEYNQYRFAWRLMETGKYLDMLPYADVDEYTGEDIPIALPGLKLRL